MDDRGARSPGRIGELRVVEGGVDQVGTRLEIRCSASSSSCRDRAAKAVIDGDSRPDGSYKGTFKIALRYTKHGKYFTTWYGVYHKPDRTTPIAETRAPMSSSTRST